MVPQSNFPGSNHHYKAFDGNEECPPYQALSVMIHHIGDGHHETSSYWKFSMAELMEMVFTGGGVWLNISG